MRDLLDASPTAMAQERDRVANEGWGASVLARRTESGHWGRAAYAPKWTSTHYTLMLLSAFGLNPEHPAARRGCELLLEHRQPDGGISYSRRAQSEECGTGMVLGLTSYFGLFDDAEGLAGNLLKCQFPDGGWNCESLIGATHSSFHTTILALEGLAAYERAVGPQAEVSAARQRAKPSSSNIGSSARTAPAP